MKNWFKKIFIPSGEKTTVIAYNSWVVRWKSVRADGSTLWYVSDEAEIFPSETDAYKFAQQLREARSLLKDKRYDDSISVTANQSKLATITE